MSKKLRVGYIGMSATNHSWSIVAQNLCRAFLVLGHDINIITTNGEMRMPPDLKPYVVVNRGPEPNDIDFTYTLPINFKQRLHARCNLGIYNYESSALPANQREGINYCDYLLPSSQYCYNIFINAGIPKEKLRLVPHGVDQAVFNPYTAPYNGLKTQKKFKFLCVAIPHARKNYEGLLTAYGSAFRKSDDVCLVIKTRVLTGQLQRHDINIVALRQQIRQHLGGKDFPEIEVVDGSIDNMASLYTACQSFVSMTHCEGFGMPFLEAMACGLPVIAPDYSGQQDFLNEYNSLPISTGVMYAPKVMQYWEFSPKALTGDPNIKHCVERMREVYNNYTSVVERLRPNMVNTVHQFSWENAANTMIDLYREKMAHPQP